MLCRQLPSDSTSRWTPLSLTVRLPLSGRVGDLHPLDYAHVGRTKGCTLSIGRNPEKFKKHANFFRADLICRSGTNLLPLLVPCENPTASAAGEGVTGNADNLAYIRDIQGFQHLTGKTGAL